MEYKIKAFYSKVEWFTDPSAYDYSGQLTWSVDPHFSLDYTCEIVYSCATEASPNGSSICAIDSGADN